MAYLVKGRRFEHVNHPGQVGERGAIDDVDDRKTDPVLFEIMDRRYMFCTDAAASAKNAQKRDFWTREDNGLLQDWRGRRVWCNPPYSDLRPWVEKAARREADIAVLLLPANRAEQAFWHEIVEPLVAKPGARYYFLRRRWKFKAPDGSVGVSPPFGLVVLEVWGGRALFAWDRQTELFSS